MSILTCMILGDDNNDDEYVDSKTNKVNLYPNMSQFNARRVSAYRMVHWYTINSIDVDSLRK